MPFRISPVVLNLIIINALVFLAWNLVPVEVMNEYFLLFKIKNLPFHETVNWGYSFKPIQIVTHFFSHADLMHIVMNMYALFLFGTALETVLGSKRFLIQYLTFGLLSGILIAVFDPSANPVLGASAAISGLLVVYAYVYPNARLGLLFIPIQFRAVHFVIGLAAISAFFVILEIITGEGGTISHFGHFMGMVVAFVYFNFPKVLKKIQGK